MSVTLTVHIYLVSVYIHSVLICLRSGNHQRKQELVKDLQRNGVTFDIRKLNVGDFLWVAREKVTPVPGDTNTPVLTVMVSVRL